MTPDAQPQRFESVMRASGRYLVRHPLPGQPKVWYVIDATTGRAIFSSCVYEAARACAVEANLDWLHNDIDAEEHHA